MPGEALRVLMVDDCVDVADALQTSLDGLGFSTAVAYDGYTAIERAIEFRPNFVVLDLDMPEMSGYQVAATR